MASSTQDQQSEIEDRDEHEATEMGRYGNVNRSDDRLTSLTEGAHTTAVTTNGRYFGSFRGSVKAFWQRQIRATVAHEACRDHFGT